GRREEGATQAREEREETCSDSAPEARVRRAREAGRAPAREGRAPAPGPARPGAPAEPRRAGAWRRPAQGHHEDQGRPAHEQNRELVPPRQGPLATKRVPPLRCGTAFRREQTLG